MTIRLAFGTAGIRATLGPADDQINPGTVAAIAHALASYVGERFAGARGRGFCIGFDGRTDSALLAQKIVEVAQAHGFRVRAFELPVPTPLLAFCTRYYDSAAGVMVTASHNPPHENGVKIYLSGGAQLSAPHDREIAARLQAFDARELPAADPAAVAYERLGESELEAYLAAIERLLEVPSSAPLPRLAYSALCGVGSAVTRRLFVRAGARDVLEVAAQAEPRSDFGGLASPNPEHEEALAELLRTADEARIDLGFAHDPDADRLAVVVRARDGRLRTLTGDEVGALIGSFLLEECRAKERALLVSTLVSGALLEYVARAHGARFERTPTGFKWIAARARALEQEAGLSFLFGYEEAIGYAFGSMADDKDGIAALYVLLELVRRLHAERRTLLDELDTLFLRHGLFATRQLSVPRSLDASAGPQLLERLREVAADALLGPGATMVDYRLAEQATDLLVLSAPDGSRLCARPSGTEPKLKLYLHTRVEVADGDLQRARSVAAERLDALQACVQALSSAAPAS